MRDNPIQVTLHISWAVTLFPNFEGLCDTGHVGIWDSYLQPLKENGVAIIINKRLQNAVLGCNLKNDRIISVHFQGKPFAITVIQIYALTTNAEEAEIELFYNIYKTF